MNFKDSYKKANEKIQGDMSILDGIYEPKKKIITPYFYRMTTIAAAFILVGTVALMSSFKEDASKEKESLLKEQSAVEETKGKFKFMSREVINEETPLNKEVEELKPKSNEVAEVESTSIEEATVPGEIKEDIAVLSLSQDTEVTIEAYNPEDAYDTQDISADIETASGGGGGSASNKAAMFSASSEDDNLMRAEEVLLLLGISKEMLLFEGMELDIPEKIKVTFNEEGVLEDFVINFSLTGPDSKIEGILINSVNPVSFEVKNEGGVISGGKTFGNTDVFIKTYNIDEEKTEEFLKRFN